jgi:hypothetical protein
MTRHVATISCHRLRRARRRRRPERSRRRTRSLGRSRRPAHCLARRNIGSISRGRAPGSRRSSAGLGLGRTQSRVTSVMRVRVPPPASRRGSCSWRFRAAGSRGAPPAAGIGGASGEPVQGTIGQAIGEAVRSPMCPYMVPLGIGERVTLHGRMYVVRGVSPMSAVPCRVWLEDADTHEHVESPLDGIERVSRSATPDPPSAQASPPLS